MLPRSSLRNKPLPSVRDGDYDRLSKAIVHDALQEFGARRSQARNLLFTVVGVTLALGSAGAAFIAFQVDRQFTALQNAELGDLRFMRDLETVVGMIASVSIGRRDVPDEIARIVDGMDRLEKAHLSVTAEDVFARAQQMRARMIPSVVNLFDGIARRGRPGDLVLLVEKMQDFSSFSQVDIQIAAQGLGREFIAAPEGAAAWLTDTGSYSAVFPTYRLTMEDSFIGGFPEFYFLFELIRLHMEDPVHPDIPPLLLGMEKMNEVDARNFHDLMTDFLTQEWRPSKDPYSARIRDRTAAFLRDHQAGVPIL